MANNKQIDLAFRIAGFTQGRPTIDNTDEAIYPNDNIQIINMFDDDMIDQLLTEAGENAKARAESVNPGFPYLFGSLVLEQIMNSGLTPEGRLTDITSATAGGLTTTFISPETYKESLRNRVSELKSRARALSSPVESFAISLPSAGGSGIDFNTLADTILPGTNVSIDQDDSGQTLTINAPYEIRAVNGFGDAVYETLKLTLKTANNVIVTFDDAREEVKFNTEIDRETLHTPLKQTLLAGNNISLTPNEINDTITIAATGTGESPVLQSETATIASGASKQFQPIPNTANLPDGTIFRITVSYPERGATAIETIILKETQLSGIFRWNLRGQTATTMNLFYLKSAGLSIRVDANDDPFTYTYLVAWGSESAMATTSVSKQEIYNQTKNILLPGTGVLIGQDDTAQTQTVGLNIAQLQSNVILSANEDVEPTAAARGKFLAVDADDEDKLTLVDPPTSTSSGTQAAADNESVIALEKRTHEIRYDGDFVWQNITATSTRARIDGSSSPDAAIDGSNLTTNNYSDVDIAIVNGARANTFNIGIRIPIADRPTDYRLSDILIGEANPQQIVTNLPKDPTATTANYYYYLIEYSFRPRSTLTIQQQITPPTIYSGTLETPQYDRVTPSWVFSDGTSKPIASLRHDAITGMFGTLSATTTARTDIRFKLSGFIQDIVDDNRPEIIFSGTTIRAYAAAHQPGEFTTNGNFACYGAFSDSTLQTILDNQTTSSSGYSLRYFGTDGDFHTITQTIPWLTTSQRTASPLAPYINPALIVGGVGGGGGGGLSIKEERLLNQTIRGGTGVNVTEAFSDADFKVTFFIITVLFNPDALTSRVPSEGASRTLIIKGSDIDDLATNFVKPSIVFDGTERYRLEVSKSNGRLRLRNTSSSPFQGVRVYIYSFKL